MKQASDCSRLAHALAAITVKKAKLGLPGNPERQAEQPEQPHDPELEALLPF